MWPFVVLQLMLVEPLHYAIIAQTICAINVNSRLSHSHPFLLKNYLFTYLCAVKLVH